MLPRRLAMRRSLSWLVLSATLGLSACTIAPRPQLPSRSIKTSEACADWRWIGISRPGAQCPEVAGWTVRPLFPQLAPALSDATCPGERNEPQKVPSPEVVRELNRFCVYEVADRKKSLRKLPFPPATSRDLVRFDQDCAALALTDTTMVREPRKLDVDTFLAEASGLKEPLEITGQLGVRLAFLDTEPTGEGVSEERPRMSLHGYTLARLAQGMVCTPGSAGQCAAQITTRLALPIIEFHPEDPKHNVIDREHGGFLGMQSDLAEAIRSEVDAWWLKRSYQRHLVLNLSLAWDGTLFGGLSAEQVADMRAGTQAVYRALEYAKGFDVLVLAAAGNQKKEPCANVGPLLPAAWEMGAPQEESCSQAEDGPLVYAVGGVQADGSPLANARPGGMPRRAAYGETEMYVGTSVSTVVASSIAAVVWDTFPDLTSREVMQILDGTGSHPSWLKEIGTGTPDGMLPMRADFWFGMGAWNAAQAAPPVRELTLCTVLRQACSERPGAACPLQPGSSCSSLSLASLQLKRSAPVRITAKGSCEPWLYPQPEDDPCPTCPPSP